MTLASAESKVTFVGNGVTTEFPFTFQVMKPEDIQVIHTALDLSESVLGVGYQVVLNDQSAGGAVIYPTDGVPLPVGEKLTLRRSLVLGQPTDLTNQGAFYPEIVETALDRQAMISQQLAEEISRAVKVPISSEDESSDYLNDIRNERQLVQGHVDSAAASANAASQSAIAAQAAELGVVPDGAVTTPALATSAVTTDKIAMSAVTTDKLAMSAVTADKLAMLSPAGLTVGAVTYPSTDGGANHVLKTDGNGALQFGALPEPNIVNNFVTGLYDYAASTDREIPPLTTSITVGAGSQVLIQAAIFYERHHDGVFYLKRNGEEIGPNPAWETARSVGLAPSFYDTDHSSTAALVNILYLDESPAAGLNTYSFWVRGGNYALAINRTITFSDTAGHERGACTVILQEII